MGAPWIMSNAWTIPVEMESQVKTIRKNQSEQENSLRELPFFDGFYTGKYIEFCICRDSDRYLYQCSYCYSQFYKKISYDESYDEYPELESITHDAWEEGDFSNKNRCDYDDDNYENYDGYYDKAEELYESAKHDAWEEWIDSFRHDGPHAPSWKCHMRY